MVWKTSPIISQSSVKLLTKKIGPYKLSPSNSIYYGRYPYKVTFDIPMETSQPWILQIRDFKMDLAGFAEDMLKHSTRQHTASQQPSMFIQDYNDLKVTLLIYGDIISEVYGPTSKDHLDLLYSRNFKCEGKQKLWYNMYDCKVEVWLPFKYRQQGNQIQNIDQDDNLISYIQDSINVHVPRTWESRYSTTVYCLFSEFVEIFPFIKMSYPNYRIDITKAVLKS